MDSRQNQITASEASTMNRVCSIFSQICSCFRGWSLKPRYESTKRSAMRAGSCWSQFVAMVFCHLGHARSLREISGGLAACEGKLRHLGLPERRNAPRCPTPTNIGLGNSSKRCSINCSRCRAGPPATSFVQEQAAQFGRDHDRTLCFGLRLGEVPAYQRSHEAAPVARSSGTACPGSP